jgi:hypothetical protein
MVQEYKLVTDRQTDRQRDRQTARQTARQIFYKLTPIHKGNFFFLWEGELGYTSLLTTQVCFTHLLCSQADKNLFIYAKTFIPYLFAGYFTFVIQTFRKHQIAFNKASRVHPKPPTKQQLPK